MKQHKQKHIDLGRKMVYVPYTQSTIIILSLTLGLLLTGMMLLGSIYSGVNIYSSLHIINYWPNIFINLSLNIILFYILFLYNFTISKKKWQERKQFIWSIIGTIFITITYMRVAMAIRDWTSPEIIQSHVKYINIIKEALISVTVLLISFLLYDMTKRQLILLENEQLQDENIRIRYDALKTKLDPHFLFNSLNTLNGMIEDNSQAQHYTEQLAEIYRYIIQKRKLVTLEEEINFTKSYLYLLQIRFCNDLRIEWKIDSTMLKRMVVPLSIQLLVENAIKHNIISKRYPLTIHISTTTKNTIIVDNEMRPQLDETTGTGLGLSNLNERYQLLINESIEIIKKNNIFSVEFPVLTEEQTVQIVKRFEI